MQADLNLIFLLLPNTRMTLNYSFVCPSDTGFTCCVTSSLRAILILETQSGGGLSRAFSPLPLTSLTIDLMPLFLWPLSASCITPLKGNACVSFFLVTHLLTPWFTSPHQLIVTGLIWFDYSKPTPPHHHPHDRVSLCGRRCPRTHVVDQASLELTEIQMPLGLKAYSTITSFFWRVIYFMY